MKSYIYILEMVCDKASYLTYHFGNGILHSLILEIDSHDPWDNRAQLVSPVYSPFSTCPQSHHKHQEAEWGCHLRSPECEMMMMMWWPQGCSGHWLQWSRTITNILILTPSHFSGLKLSNKTGLWRLKWRVGGRGRLREAGRRPGPLIGSAGGGQERSLGQSGGK